MSTTVGTSQSPLRVAIIGSGPSGFYAAEHLQKQPDLNVQVDMFDRLPTPFGLVRGGVAPDHPKIKTVTKVYEATANNPNFRFYGNVTLGKDLTHEDLLHFYHVIIYAVGAQTDRQMGIPGESLSGSHAATEFVGWYNAHPDYCHLEFDLTQENVAIIGNGNVAMDVARILASTDAELAQTDIADYALHALRTSHVRNIYVLGRRGPAQAAFTNPEIRELGKLSCAQVVIDADELALDPASEALINGDRNIERNVQVMHQYTLESDDPSRPRKIHMKFLVSPVSINGTDRVESITLVKNELYQDADGTLRPRPTDETITIPVGLVFRSIGYMGVALEGVPFDARKGIIPHEQGRVIAPETQTIRQGEYVVGWIKRGPSGIIGTNKPDSIATANAVLEDVTANSVNVPAETSRAALEAMLDARNIRYVTFADWQRLDEQEKARGAESGRPRVKYANIAEMLAVIEATKA